MGLGPESARKEDVVVILYGGEWPFVLRRESDFYRYIGPCYVKAIMDGEVVKRREECKEQPVVFELR